MPSNLNSIGPAYVVFNEDGTVRGLYDPKTDSTVAVADYEGVGEGAFSTNLTEAGVEGTKDVIKVFTAFTIGTNFGSGASFPPRVAVSQLNRKSITFRNPVHNTASVQFGYRDSDNIQNANNQFVSPITLAPGEEAVSYWDRNQWWCKQTTASPSVAVEIEVEEVFAL
jgi:hypothetical protein